MTKTVLGTNGSDLISGSALDEEFWGLDGLDSIVGGGGNDIFHESGSFSAFGFDTLVGGTGNDIFYIDGGAVTVKTAGGFDQLIFGGSVISYGFNVTDFDPKNDLILISGKFPIFNGKSISLLQEIPSDGVVGADSVFVKVTNTLSSPDSVSSVAALLFNLDLSNVIWGDEILVLVGNSTKTVLWRLEPDSIPKIQESQLTYVGILSSTSINEINRNSILHLGMVCITPAKARVDA